jgi:beta-lactamase class A
MGMHSLITRRVALGGALLAVSALLSRGAKAATAAELKERLVQIESRRGGRIGLAVLDVAAGRRIDYRADERFALCSTFKVLAVAHVLSRVDRGEERLERRIAFGEEDVVLNSPATQGRVGGDGMTVLRLCEAAITLSDNTAGNLLLASAGGPAGLTAYARSLGDRVTRLDRIEPELSQASFGDPRDTTTPAAMLEDLHQVVLGDALSEPSREQLTAWLIGNKSGDKRLRAGLPESWLVGDKTGSGDNGATNDIAVVWPPDRAPIIVCAYFAESPASPDDRNAILETIGRLVGETV